MPDEIAAPKKPPTPQADRLAVAIGQVRQALETLRTVDPRYLRGDVRPLVRGCANQLGATAWNLENLERQLRGDGGLAPDPAQRPPAVTHHPVG